MRTHFMDVVGEAIRTWPTTIRLCVIIVVAVTMIIYVHVMGLPALPGLMK